MPPSPARAWSTKVSRCRSCEGFRTGGTIHVIVNNQIGFTTSPAYARSSPYPSDVARSVQAPIFHVNGDDPEAVVHVGQLAAEFRQKFKKDVVVDVWCYRRHGHNEADEPSFTQPLMYRRIAQHPTTRQIYARRLVAEGVIGEDQAQAIFDGFQEQLAAAHEASAGYKMNKVDWLEGAWTGLSKAPSEYERGATAVAVERLREIGLEMTEIPPEVHVHRKLRRILGQRREAIEAGQDIDWATAEHLAFGSLVREGFLVRLSGQDSRPRHVLPAPCDPLRPGDRGALYPAQPSRPRAGALRGGRQLPLRGGRARLRVRLLARRPELAGAVGGAVRRLRERRAGLFRPVHRARRGQVAAHVGAGVPAAPRLRGAGARAQLGAARALPAALRQGQHPGALPVDAGVLLPRAAPADAPAVPQALDRDDAEVAAAPQALHLEPRGDGARAAASTG